jgi:hypothetical protein
MPDGKLMIEKSVEKFDLTKFDKVLIVCLKEHVDQYLSESNFNQILFNIAGEKAEAVMLDQPTSSQSETVINALKIGEVSGSFFVKDCDNMFEFDYDGGNEIAVIDLNSVELIDAKNKSYVETNSLRRVSNIVEKQVVSNLFCCGGYGFENAKKFINEYENIDSDKEIYLSHVIYSMLLKGENFFAKNASQYVDWGTLREYRHYAKSYITIFCDVDGVLFTNGSKFGKKGWFTEPIAENLSALKKLQDDGRLYLVITSSRPESQIDYVSKKLGDSGISVDRFVMDLPHARRLLVNDFSNTNPFPSALSINLERDSKILSTLIESIV